MKYIGYWEFSPEDMGKVMKKFVEYRQDGEKNPGKYLEYLYPPQFTGQTTGFSIVEATPEEINNVIIYWTPLLKLEYKPIREVAKFAEQYMKFK